MTTTGSVGGDRPPTLRDVARTAEVSYQTVSRYLNRPETVAGDTARRIQRAIDELRYVPNEAARALRRGGGLRRPEAAPAAS
jgi:LacI family transcriptional regulator